MMPFEFFRLLNFEKILYCILGFNFFSSVYIKNLAEFLYKALII